MATEPKVEIYQKDNDAGGFRVRLYDLDASTGAIFMWNITVAGSAVSEDYYGSVKAGKSEWISPWIYGYYPKSNEGEFPEYITFQHDLLYGATFSVSTGDLVTYVVSGTFKFNVVYEGEPYVTDFKFKQTDNTGNGTISCTLNTVYPIVSEIGIKGTWFYLKYKPADSDEEILFCDVWLHKALSTGNWNYYPLTAEIDRFDEQKVHLKWDVFGQTGDTYTIEMVNAYYEQAAKPSRPASIILQILTPKPQLLFEVIPEDIYSYDNGRVTGVIKNNIKIISTDWNTFMARLRENYNYPELNIDWTDVNMGEGLTASRWNAVIKTLKRYYEAKGLELDERIQEVVKGQKITPEMFILVNDAFQY